MAIAAGTTDRTRDEPGLQRGRVGLPTAIATTFSLITATGVLITVPQGFAASWLFLIALLIGLVTMYLQSMSFSELATMIPRAGSMNEYVRAGLGPFFATVAVFMGYIAIAVFPGSTEAFFAATIATEFLGAPLGLDWWVVLFIGLVVLINAAGVVSFAVIEILLTFAVAVSMFAFAVIGLAGWGTEAPVQTALPGVPWDGDLLLALLGLAIFTFVGVEYTCPLAEELRRPARDIPLGIFVGLTLVGIPLILYGIAAIRYVPLDQLADPTQLTHMNVAIAMLGDTGKWWMGIVSIMATLATLNAVSAGIPRILYGMALDRQLPSVFAYLLPATRAPIVGILLIGLAGILMNVLDATQGETFIELILAGVLGWATAYVLIHLSLMSLRWRRPDVPRPFRSPLFPIPQLAGIGLLVLAAVKIFPDPATRSNIYRNYLIFLGISVVFALLYNAFAMRSATRQFRPVPLDAVRAETGEISGHLPPAHQ